MFEAHPVEALVVRRSELDELCRHPSSTMSGSEECAYETWPVTSVGTTTVASLLIGRTRPVLAGS